MAENENNQTAARREDLTVAIAMALFEVGLCIETVQAGFEVLVQQQPEPLRTQFSTMLRLMNQSGEAFELLSKLLHDVLPLRGLDA